MTLDVMLPPPIRFSPKIPRYLGNLEELNKFELVFDERIEDGFHGDTIIIDSKMLI